MYWSSFSETWYELTLKEIGFELMGKYKEVKEFLGQRETTWYILCRKPESNPLFSPTIYFQNVLDE